MKKWNSTVLLGLLLGWVMLFSACELSTKRVVFAAEAEPADFSLNATKPEVFAFELPANETGPFDLALELTYFDNQLQGWEVLPLAYNLVYPDGKQDRKTFNLRIKDEKGEWRGQLKENMTDRILEENFAAGLSLPSGKYSLQLFGDSQDPTKPILGIVRVTLKVYAQ